jgi:putative ABC transport system ATP-binding protein
MASRGGRERVLAAVRSLLHELGLEELVFDAGLEFNIGHGGTRLSAAQRQKIGVARALLKRPDYAIFKQPLSTLNVEAQEEIIREVLNCSRDAAQPFGLLWVTSTPRFAHLFDRVAVFERGVLVEFGPPAQLATEGGSAAKLLAHA